MQQNPQRAFIRYETISQMHGGMGTHSFGDLIELVRQGYKVAAIPYNEQKDISVLSLPIFQHWVALVPEGTVAELGCGSGFPVAHHLAHVWRSQGSTRKYIGIDLSEEQIEIAKQLMMKDTDVCNFTVREMLDWCRKQRDNSVSGILALFAINHLPRNHHVELFTQIGRILRDGAPVLFTTQGKASEGYEVWLGGCKMFWSSFSANWYETTLQDLGFEFVSKSKDNSQKEDTYFLLYRKMAGNPNMNIQFSPQLSPHSSPHHMQQGVLPPIMNISQHQQMDTPPQSPLMNGMLLTEEQFFQ